VGDPGEHDGTSNAVENADDTACNVKEEFNMICKYLTEEETFSLIFLNVLQTYLT